MKLAFMVQLRGRSSPGLLIYPSNEPLEALSGEYYSTTTVEWSLCLYAYAYAAA